MSRLHNYGLTEASDTAYDLHIITPDLYDRWHAGLESPQQNWLAAQNFTPKPGVAICLPDNDGHIHQAVGVERVVVSTYQAASGAGAAAMNELAQQARDWAAGDPITQEVFDRQYIWNLFSHNSRIDPDTGYNEEETKMINETRKLFADPQISVSATCVRVPVLRAHSEAINLTLKSPLYEKISSPYFEFVNVNDKRIV